MSNAVALSKDGNPVVLEVVSAAEATPKLQLCALLVLRLEGDLQIGSEAAEADSVVASAVAVAASEATAAGSPAATDLRLAADVLPAAASASKEGEASAAGTVVTVESLAVEGAAMVEEIDTAVREEGLRTEKECRMPRRDLVAVVVDMAIEVGSPIVEEVEVAALADTREATEAVAGMSATAGAVGMATATIALREDTVIAMADLGVAHSAVTGMVTGTVGGMAGATADATADATAGGMADVIAATVETAAEGMADTVTTEIRTAATGSDLTTMVSTAEGTAIGEGIRNISDWALCRQFKGIFSCIFRPWV